MALFLDTSGGAWDNAKKYIELGNHGGKNSEAHKCSITGKLILALMAEVNVWVETYTIHILEFRRRLCWRSVQRHGRPKFACCD